MRNLFQGVALKLYGIQKGDQSVPVMQEVLDHYKLRAGDTFLPLSEYPDWSRMLDCDQAEQAYTATMQALNRNAVEVRTNDVRFETRTTSTDSTRASRIEPQVPPGSVQSLRSRACGV